MRFLPDFKNLPFFQKKEESFSEVFYTKEQAGGRKFLFLLLVLFIAGVVLSIGGYFWWQQKQEKPPQPAPVVALPPDGVAKVGNEVIYKTDLLSEVAYYPLLESQKEELKKDLPALKEKFLAKVSEDSVILQKAQENGLISLDNTVFNSPNKDYAKRIELVKKAKETLQIYEGQISGESIAIWCYNVYRPKIGIEKAKEIAREKIEKLYQDLKAGKITMKEAGEIIKNDSSLTDIDPQYKTNAYQKFENLSRGKPYFFNDKANQVLWSLKEGELSSILTLKDTNADGQVRDSVFLIIKVTKREGKF